METTFQLMNRMQSLEQTYTELILELRVAEQEYQSVLEEYQRKKTPLLFDADFQQFLKSYPALRNSSTMMAQAMDAWLDQHHDGLASRYYLLHSKVQSLRDLLRRYEPLIDLVRQQAILASVEAKIAAGA